ncbi:NADP-dependent oxidoreductase [Actinomadura verrucosospora]|uniref:Alcohol dehydrogenase zinc-binding domain protein n=1 Tax=Actinomadura verrucosospora TaxID=46165 RepID=A0A7D3VSV0_ACTVE|nr:NADP-dependent oxidoreductase [Actinomadura verrucosospora]QKG22040.1 alcohol dehydrogenase zinc-binding domain protein [Actinomadura verrucosospora]
MRAVIQREWGGPDVLEVAEVPRPDAGPGEVLVRVVAAGVNPADWKIRSGAVRRFGEPPFTLGLDVAGVVEAVGDGVSGFRPGDAVFGNAAPPDGAYAEFAAVPQARLAHVPDGLDLVHAAALPTAALTAWQPLVRVAGVSAGQRVLVHAAAGGVGHLAVQIAKARGAHVIGTARAAKHAFLRGLGADELVDYTAVDFAEAVRDVDVVLDPIAGDYGPRSLRTLKPGGLLIDVRGTGPDRAEVRRLAGEAGLRFTEFGFTPSGADLAELAEAGVRAVVDEVLPLEDAAKAHALSETGRAAGKIVLAV